MVAASPLTRLSVDAVIERFLDDMDARTHAGNLSNKTLANYTADLYDFAAIVGGRTVLDDVTAQHLENTIGAYRRIPDRRPAGGAGGRRSDATVARFVQSVGALFRYAETRRWVDVSPTRLAHTTTVKHPPLSPDRKALDPLQARALLRYGAGPADDPAARSHERNQARDRFVIATLMLCGLRVSELVATNRGDLRDYHASTGDDVKLWEVRGKGNKRRTVPLSPALIGLLDAYLAQRPTAQPGHDDALLLTGRGNRMSVRDVERMLDRAYQHVKAAEPARARRATPHALRHTCATLMLHDGYDLKVIQKLLGHADLATTSRYTDELPDELVGAVVGASLAAEIAT